MELRAIGPMTCDRCDRHTDDAVVDDQYLVDDPQAATGALCPACAAADDPHHVPGSWLLTWGS